VDQLTSAGLFVTIAVACAALFSVFLRILAMFQASGIFAAWMFSTVLFAVVLFTAASIHRAAVFGAMIFRALVRIAGMM
jgi:hypothetical protein